ncbi:MAG TPA: SRPBCC domain-containing protein [Verrucomicrobiae bacterium]|nr:SRPBCC domain-containing protein [Verrucomicrobiae bacterium]
MKNEHPITVRVSIQAPIGKVWEYWNAPEHITQWAFASDDWECPAAENDLREGGKGKTTMAAKDGSFSFDLVVTYTAVREPELIEYDMENGRHVKIEFHQTDGGVEVVETFDPEQENSEERQREGWQAILDNFKKHVETA